MRRYLFPLAVALSVLLAFFVALPAMALWPTLAWRTRVAHAYAAFVSRVALLAAGVRLEVSGREHLRTHPAVFGFNHVSGLDFFIMSIVAPYGTLVFGKRELGRIPCLGWIWLLSGHPLIRRSERGQWQALMDRVEGQMRQGRFGALIAPEGTRARDGRLGPFKKGAFHLCLGSGAPFVPVVIDGVAALQAPVGPRPGVVRVRVLPPIPAADWREATLDEHVTAVRELYLDALGQRELTPAASAPGERTAPGPHGSGPYRT